jgi:hypothetical protein
MLMNAADYRESLRAQAIAVSASPRASRNVSNTRH